MNNQLIEFENQLDIMSKQKLYFIYISMVALLIYLSWNLIGESLTSDIELKQNSISSLEMKLRKNNMKSIELAIKKTKNEKLVLAESLDQLKSKNMYISSKLESVDFIFFNQMGIAKILDDILKESLEYSIDINQITYQSIDKLYTANIFEKENIMVSGSASFKNIINLMQHIDSIKSLLRINSFNIYIDQNNSVNFNINISHYGAEL